MKDLIQYLNLWQKKRGELQIDTDAGADWMEMRALLDKHMPGNDDNGGGSKPGGIRLLPTILITLSAAAMIYFAAKVVQTKLKADHTKNEIHKSHGLNRAGNDSLAKSGNSQPGSDSIGNSDQPSAAENKAGRTPSSIKPGKLQSGSDSAGNMRQPSGTENKADRNAFPAKPGKPQSGSESASNTNQYANAAHKTGRNASLVKSGKPQSGSDSASNTNQYSDAEHKTGSKLLDASNKPSGRINSSTAKISSSDAAGIKKSAHMKKDNSTANKDLVQTVAGTSFPDKLNGYGRRGRRAGNTAPARPGSSAGATDKDNLGEGGSTSPSRTTDQFPNQRKELMLLPQPGQSLFESSGEIANYPIDKVVIKKGPLSPAETQKNKANRPNGAFEWGVLIGTNSNGSFTAKNLNHNYYGSLPVDIFTGAYGTYHLNPKWGIGTQVMILSPMVVKGGTYADPLAAHGNISDSKKVYSVEFPLYATYQLTKSIGFKAGPVISFPVKQYNTNTRIDSVSSSIINHSRYDQKTDFGFTGGINFRYKRMIFETSYLKGFTRHNIMSDSLIHKSTNNTFQFTLKLQLGNIKE